MGQHQFLSRSMRNIYDNSTSNHISKSTEQQMKFPIKLEKLMHSNVKTKFNFTDTERQKKLKMQQINTTKKKQTPKQKVIAKQSRNTSAQEYEKQYKVNILIQIILNIKSIIKDESIQRNSILKKKIYVYGILAQILFKDLCHKETQIMGDKFKIFLKVQLLQYQQNKQGGSNNNLQQNSHKTILINEILVNSKNNLEQKKRQDLQKILKSSVCTTRKKAFLNFGKKSKLHKQYKLALLNNQIENILQNKQKDSLEFRIEFQQEKQQKPKDDKITVTEKINENLTEAILGKGTLDSLHTYRSSFCFSKFNGLKIQSSRKNSQDFQNSLQLPNNCDYYQISPFGKAVIKNKQYQSNLASPLTLLTPDISPRLEKKSLFHFSKKLAK